MAATAGSSRRLGRGRAARGAAVRAAHHLDADGHDMHDEEKAWPHPPTSTSTASVRVVANEMGFVDCENTPVVAALDYLEANCQTEMLVSKSEADEEVCP